MTTAKHGALTLALTFCALLVNVHAQTPRMATVNIAPDADKVQISAIGDVSEMRVDVADEQGEVVFQSGQITGNALDWNMRDAQGERVSAGTYLVTVTFRNAAGKLRKRVGQVTVDEAEKVETMRTLEPEAVQANITGAGTAGKIAKFTGAATIANSIITESATKRIGINNTAPTATLQVNAAQPPPLAGNGTSAATLLQTSGGKGGNTNGAAAGFQNAGAGASISLLAGNGGDAPAGSRRGNGGSITLQPGSTGTGAGLAGVSGNVLIDPSGVGNVGIGVLAPVSKVHIRSALGDKPPRLEAPGRPSFVGWDFYHRTTPKGYVGVSGDSSGSSNLGEMMLYGSGGVDTSLWAGGERRVTITNLGLVGIGTNDPAYKLHVVGVPALGAAIAGISEGTDGVYGHSDSDSGILGTSDTGVGVYGRSSSNYAGRFDGQVLVTGNLQVGSCTGCTISSDQNLKTNFSTINPRFVLDRLSTIPIKAWNYKSDEPAVRHIGPMAQDFRAAFNLGVDDKHIDMIDANGVTMASIQALYQMMQEKDQQNEQLTRTVQQQSSQIETLARKVEQQQAQLNQVKRTIKRKRAARR